MSFFESIILGIVQGLTEFLPVSSSGHLLIAKELLGVNDGGTTFEVMVHGGTVLSTFIVFRKDIRELLKGFFAFKYSPAMGMSINLLVSLLPLVLVYVLCREWIDALYQPPYNLVIMGFSLIFTAVLLTFTHFVRSSQKPVDMQSAFIIGIAQSLALLPGLSRSGATISTGLLLGCRREEVARFSFLMVLIPVIGETLLMLLAGEFSPAASGIPVSSLAAAFVTALLTGVVACRAMIAIVKRSKLTWFAVYCALVGIGVLIYVHV